jgi:hypothetical protein
MARTRQAAAGNGVAQRSFEIPTSSTDAQALPVKLIALILASQIFDYNSWDFPASKLVFTVTPDRFFLVLLFLVVGARFLSGRFRLRSAGGGEVYIMGLFGALCTMSWIFTGLDFGTVRYRWLTTLFNLIYFPFGVYLIAKNTLYKRPSTISLLWAIVGIGTYLAITGVCEHFRVNWLVWPKYILDPTIGIQFGRVRGPFASSVAMGEWLIITFIGASLLLQFTSGVSGWYLRGLTGLAIIVIYFTNTREVWLSFAAVVVIGICFGSGLRARLLSVVLIVLMAFLIGIGSKFSAGQKTLFSRRQETVNYRLANYQTDYKMGMNNFFFGVGYGNFKYEWRKYFGPEERQLVKDLTDGNHNTYLGLFAETGIFGLLLYVSLLLYLGGKCIASWWQLPAEADFEKNFAVTSLGLVAVMMIEAVFSDQRFDPILNVILFLCVGVAASMRISGEDGARLGRLAKMPLKAGPPRLKSGFVRRPTAKCE